MQRVHALGRGAGGGHNLDYAAGGGPAGGNGGADGRVCIRKGKWWWLTHRHLKNMVSQKSRFFLE